MVEESNDNCMKSLKKRNSAIEILRVLCIFGIIIMHKSGPLLENANGWQVWYLCIISCFNAESTILMLIASYYGNPYSSKRRLFKLWIMVLLYRWISFGIEFFRNGITDYSVILKNILPISSGFSWFACAYIIIFMLAPYIEKMLDCLDERGFKGLLLVMFSFYIIMPSFLYIAIEPNSGKNMLTMLCVYLLGRYIKKYHIFVCVSVKRWAVAVVLLSLLQLLLARGTCFIWNIVGREGAWMPFSRDLSITNVLLGVSIVGFVSNFTFYNKAVNSLGKHAYEMLLLEELAIVPFNYLLFENNIIFVILVVSNAVISMAEGFLAAVVRAKFFGGIEDRIMNRVVDNIKPIIFRIV